MISQHEHYSIPLVLLGLTVHPSTIVKLIALGFDWMDVVFYAIAVYAGYRTAVTAPKPRTVPADAPAP